AEDKLRVVIVGGGLVLRLFWVGHAGKSELRVPPGKLAIAQSGMKRNFVTHVFWNMQPVVDGISGAWWYQMHIDNRSRCPGVALVDRISMSIHLKRAVTGAASPTAPGVIFASASSPTANVVAISD